MIFVLVTGVVPSVYVIDHGAVPVRATEKVALAPAQTEAGPVITAVGPWFTTTVTGAEVAEQPLASVVVAV